VWSKKKNQPFGLLCTLKYRDVLRDTFVTSLTTEVSDGYEGSSESKSQDCKGSIIGFQPDFCYKGKMTGLCIVYDDWVTVWNETDYSLIAQLHFDKEEGCQVKQVVFDGKGKRIALLTTAGLKIIDIETGEQLWKLDFQSVKSIHSNGWRNSQFFITMNSEDDVTGVEDAIIIFSFSSCKPLKIVKFAQNDYVTFGKYVNLNNLDSPSICLITSKGYIQYINWMKRGETGFNTRMELIKKENSLTSPAITPMVNFGDLDDELEEFHLDQSKSFVNFRNKNWGSQAGQAI
jgi:hypothetical protein